MADTALPDASFSPNPIDQFRRWFGEAQHHPGLELPEAMCLSTVDARGRPAARMVLLKDVAPNGFTFYTNVRSPKGQDLLARRHAALTFYWRPLGRQIRIEGSAKRLAKKIADDYFATRTRLSQIGSWASRQSRPLADRDALLKAVRELEIKYAGRDVPAPPHWAGFIVSPSRVEFWEEGRNRLHDRWLYVRGRAGTWKMTRLYP